MYRKSVQSLLIITIFLSQAIARAQPVATSVVPQVTDTPSAVSGVLLSRLGLPNNSSNNGWLNEMTLYYNLTKSWTLTADGAFYKMTDPASDSNTDWWDTELRLTYTFKYMASRIYNWTFDFTGVAVLPTAHADIARTETGGAGAFQVTSLDLPLVTLTLRNKAYQFFYTLQQVPIGAPQAPLPTEGDDPSANSPAPIPTASNIEYYFDEYFISEGSIFSAKLRLRNEVRSEAYVHFDGEVQNIWHDKPGLGYLWNKHVATWVFQDFAKDTRMPGNITDPQFQTTQLSLFLKF